MFFSFTLMYIVYIFPLHISNLVSSSLALYSKEIPNKYLHLEIFAISLIKESGQTGVEERYLKYFMLHNDTIQKSRNFHNSKTFQIRVNLSANGFILKQLCRISTNWKKMPHKIYVSASNGVQNKNLK